MSILVVGSVALDTVKTPFGAVEDALGGAAVYFSAAASYFAPVNLVGVVGDDFDRGLLDFLVPRNVDLRGLEVKPGKTFRWGGIYLDDLNARETTFTHLNVFEEFQPVIPEAYKNADFIFLANIAPELQLDVLRQVNAPRLVALDTMNYWIEGSLPALKALLKKVHVLIINDSEARQLSGEFNLVKASRAIQEMGPRVIIIKKGEHGAVMVAEDFSFFSAPAFPLESICDPTGAGDTFAGGFMGYLARAGEPSEEHFRQALIFGSTMASFCVEKFSLEKLVGLSQQEIRDRFLDFWKMTCFSPEAT
ncbi:MAG: PfkB family carbohydrate kinase [bacterium]